MYSHSRETVRQEIQRISSILDVEALKLDELESMTDSADSHVPALIFATFNQFIANLDGVYGVGFCR